MGPLCGLDGDANLGDWITSHNDLGLRYARLYAFVWQHLTAIDVYFVFDDDIFAKHSGPFHAYPATNC